MIERLLEAAETSSRSPRIDERVALGEQVGPLAGVVTRSVVMQEGRVAYDGPLVPSMLGASDGTVAAVGHEQPGHGGHDHGHHHHVHDPADRSSRSWLDPLFGRH